MALLLFKIKIRGRVRRGGIVLFVVVLRGGVRGGFRRRGILGFRV